MTYGIEGVQRAVPSDLHLNTGTYTQVAYGVAPQQSAYGTRVPSLASPPMNSYSTNPESSRDGVGITYPGITMSEFQELNRRVGVIESTLARMDERLSHMATRAWTLGGVVTALLVIISGFIWLAKLIVLSHLSH